MFNEDRFQVTHVGSLARPAELQDFLRALENNEPFDEAAFEECLRSSVVEVVRHQHEIGIDFVSDGEFGKTQTWAWYIRDRLNGFEERPLPETDLVGPKDPSRLGEDRRVYADFYADYFRSHPVAEGVREHGMSVCVGPISYAGQAAIARDIDDLKHAMQQTGARQGFLPVVAPSSAVPIRVDEHYTSEEDFIFALADALNEEYRAVVDAGLYVQIDDAYLATMYDNMVPPATMADYRQWAELRVEALKRALNAVPPERARYHVCWGSWNGPHSTDVPLREIVDLPPGPCRRLCARAGQPAPRARVARLAGRRPAR